MQLDNEVALVTGASRGIGQAIARVLGKAGAAVIGTATSGEGAQAISAWLAEQGIRGTGAVYVAGKPEAVEQLMAAAEAGPGLPTILVNNAGIARDALALRMKNEDWDETIAVNLNAAFRLSRAVLRRMLKERRGRIINIGSVIGSIGNPGQAHYAAAKAGMIGMSKSLARELGSRGITVNTVAPGFIETDMTRSLPEAQREAYLAQIPLGRFGGPEEVAQAVLFLAGPHGAYLTGQTLHVNGGLFMP